MAPKLEYTIEYGTSLVKCIGGCSQMIRKGELRVGTRDEGKKIWKYQHGLCITDKVMGGILREDPGSPYRLTESGVENLDGYINLSEEDQKNIKKRFLQYSDKISDKIAKESTTVYDADSDTVYDTDSDTVYDTDTDPITRKELKRALGIVVTYLQSIGSRL